MAISLAKGASMSLTKAAGPVPLDVVQVRLGWAPADGDQDFDLDASMLLLDPLGRVGNPDDFVFYNNLSHDSGSVVHAGDNLVGGGADDEVIVVTLNHVPTRVDRALVLVTIHEAATRGQHFGQVDDAYIRVVNMANEQELARFDLTQGAAGEDCLAFGELYRDGEEWGFAAVGEYHRGGLAAALASYGLAAS
ncbi:TerD family protein [Dermatophilaceae bacterium Soc4.6]